VQLVFSAELLLEFLDVVKRPKLKKYFAKTDIENLLEIIEEYAVFIEVTSVVDSCRDKKDNFLLALAKDSSANYLITGDNDLLEIKKFEETEIITITEYKVKIDK
jgi:putative PIN family toxin of toxin-antitoxin system